ncbi:hypothetical protein SAMN02910357_00834 [Succinivibrio dextrinosolvens]|uniref:hypothetical protein n=1 Tax=Succinivibrio dextrinosolvens TaxID=83771 RepID=UPI0008E60DBA|nr:hypothetical protein [Succinivibrio dextrinosolvens]SFS45293.1 hypothetical protein SAMN02910357_00834 [Succinivibrio dextrinosolvens]
MGQEFVYSALPRPTLRPSDLVYRRRVSKSDSGDNTKGTSSKEHKYELENSDKKDFSEVYEDEKDKTKNRIDAVV